MVTAAAPGWEAGGPPVWLTDSRMKGRGSSASRCSPRRSSLRSAAGSSMVFSSSYAPGSYSVDPAPGPLPGRSACPIALMRAIIRQFAAGRSLGLIHLELAQDDEIRELREPSRAGAQLGKRGLRLFAQFLGERLRAREPEHRDVGRLVVRRVLAGGLAERRGRGLLVEHVGYHLAS